MQAESVIVMRFALLMLATAAILAPVAVLAGCRRAIEAACREVGSWPIALALAAAVGAVWLHIYLDGVRLGWWAALAERSGLMR